MLLPTSRDTGRNGRWRIDDFGGRFGVVVAWALVTLVFCLLRPDTFATWSNFQSIFGSQAVLLILALGLVLSLTVGEIDLSITGVMSVSVVLVGWLNVEHGWGIVPTLVAALATGLLAGIVNAFLVVVAAVDSIVVTLGMGTLLSGLAVAIDIETETGISQHLVDAVSDEFLGLPLAFWYAVGLTGAIWYVFAYTPLGRYMHFVRMGRDVARLAGIRVDLIRAGALVATSVVAALAGIVEVGVLASSDPNISVAFLLPAFSAAFLGSTTISPGRFNAWGTFVGVYFLITGITGLQLLGLSGWIESVFYGGSLVLAVVFSRLVARYELQRRSRSSPKAPESLSAGPANGYGRLASPREPGTE